MVDDGFNYFYDGFISYFIVCFLWFVENFLVIFVCGMMKCYFLCLIYIFGFYM